MGGHIGPPLQCLNGGRTVGPVKDFVRELEISHSKQCLFKEGRGTRAGIPFHCPAGSQGFGLVPERFEDEDLFDGSGNAHFFDFHETFRVGFQILP